MIKRFMTNLCSDHLLASKTFYTTMFDLTVNFDSDWFIQLQDDKTGLELGLILRTSEIVPEAYRLTPQGFYLTFVVDDVEPYFQRAQDENFTIVQAPHDTFYGQRRLLLRDPDGTLVDVSAPIPNFQFQ
ncbi:MAG: VOC family protein [Saprospiraceae bacterium]|nr:VOC family protein [Saprospiraceae bacterium]